MSKAPLHVLIIGGGLGGLCLAQGLRQAGIRVALYERDSTSVFRRQGYRIHIDARGATSLHACLPPHLFDLFMATTSQPSTQVTVINKQLKKLKVIGTTEMASDEPAKLSTAVDRLTLREILLADLDDVVRFGKEFSHYQQQTDGSIQAYFTDGTIAQGDLLVAADGINSRIRQQFLPHLTITDTDMRCIYGKTLLTEATQALIPNFLHRGFSVVVDQQQVSMALGLVEFRQTPAEAAAHLAPHVSFYTKGSYLMWSLNAPRAYFAESDQELFHLNGLQLQTLTLKKIKYWHPDIRQLVVASDPVEIFPIAVRVSVPCEPWQSTNITLLGDAIHAMSPAGGSGANMALLDAYRLCQALSTVASAEKTQPQAIHDYETRMLEEGFDAVRFSARGGIFQTETPDKRSQWHKLFRH